MSEQLVQILEGNTFVVSDRNGDIEASLTDPTGLFSFDTRFLSKWVLTLDGERLNALSTDDLQYFQTRFFLVPGTGTVYVDADLSVIRERSVGAGFRESIQILNHKLEPVTLTVRIEAASDFADLFEVKDALAKKGDVQVDGREGCARPRLRPRDLRRETRISVLGAGEGGRRGTHLRGRTSTPTAAGRRCWRSPPCCRECSAGDRPGTGPPGGADPQHGPGTRQVGRPRAPRSSATTTGLKATYSRSLVDLAALRFSPRDHGRALAARPPDCPGS